MGVFHQPNRDVLMKLTVEVEFSSVFDTACSSPRLAIELEAHEANVRHLLYHLSKLYGEKMRRLLFEKGQELVLSGLAVMVNDRVFTGVALNQQDVALWEGDKVSLLYFVSGG